MKDFNLDSDLDATLGDHDVQMANNDDEIIQKVGITLRTRLLEFDPDGDVGLEDENMLGKNIVDEYAEQDIRDAITDQVADIASVNNINIKQADNSRKLTISINLTTNAGNELNQDYSFEEGEGDD